MEEIDDSITKWLGCFGKYTMKKSEIKIPAEIKKDLIVFLIVFQASFLKEMRFHEGFDYLNPKPFPKFYTVIASCIFFEATNEPRFIGTVLGKLI